jgi:hypothetical protein
MLTHVLDDSRRFSLSISALLLFMLVAGYVRCRRLDSVALQPDEAFSWRLIQCSPQQLLQRTAADVHPPLYYLLLQAWVHCWGDSLVALRSLSVILGILCLPVLYLLCVEVSLRWGEDGHSVSSSARTGALFATMLLAIQGDQVMAAQWARMYTLAAVACPACPSRPMVVVRLWARRRGFLLYALLCVLHDPRPDTFCHHRIDASVAAATPSAYPEVGCRLPGRGGSRSVALSSLVPDLAPANLGGVAGFLGAGNPPAAVRQHLSLLERGNRISGSVGGAYLAFLARRLHSRDSGVSRPRRLFSPLASSGSLASVSGDFNLEWASSLRGALFNLRPIFSFGFLGVGLDTPSRQSGTSLPGYFGGNADLARSLESRSLRAGRATRSGFGSEFPQADPSTRRRPLYR